VDRESQLFGEVADIVYKIELLADLERVGRVGAGLGEGLSTPEQAELSSGELGVITSREGRAGDQREQQWEA